MSSTTAVAVGLVALEVDGHGEVAIALGDTTVGAPVKIRQYKSTLITYVHTNVVLAILVNLK